MSITLKKCWVTNIAGDVHNITLESETPEVKNGGKIHVQQNEFPVNPSPEHPFRHTVVIGSFDTADLEHITQVLLDAMYGEGEYIITPDGVIS